MEFKWNGADQLTFAFQEKCLAKLSGTMSLKNKTKKKKKVMWQYTIVLISKQKKAPDHSLKVLNVKLNVGIRPQPSTYWQLSGLNWENWRATGIPASWWAAADGGNCGINNTATASRKFAEGECLSVWSVGSVPTLSLTSKELCHTGRILSLQACGRVVAQPPRLICLILKSPQQQLAQNTGTSTFVGKVMRNHAQCFLLHFKSLFIIIRKVPQSPASL